MSNFKNLVIPSPEEYVKALREYLLINYNNMIMYNKYEDFMRSWNKQLKYHEKRSIENYE